MNETGYTDEQRRALADLVAFVEHCLRTGEFPFDVVLRTLDHDVQGLGRPDPTGTFLPRTSGYAKKPTSE